MRTSELLLQDFDIEISNTRRTLERIQDDKRDWTPHPKSMPMGRLAMHCATLPLFGLYIIEDNGMDLAAPTRPHPSLVWESRDTALQALDDAAAQCRAAMASASDEHLAQEWLFKWGDQIISKAPRSLSFRQMCFDHLIHHTAQLGVYLRLNDIPVPALYGPSADEQWSPK